MRTFIRYFPIVYAFGSGAFVLFVFLQRIYMGTWKGTILRYNFSTPVLLGLVTPLLAVSWYWLLQDFGSEHDDGKDR